MIPRVNVIRAEGAEFMLLATGDLMSRTILRTGVWENHVLEMARVFYTKAERPIVLDIGANLGAFAVRVGKDVMDKGGLVYAFEPQRMIYYQLCGNVFLNRLDNVHAINAAMGETQGGTDIPEVDLWKCHNIGAFSLDRNVCEFQGIAGSLSEHTGKVQVMTLDALPDHITPCFIKIDVEGWEEAVIKGGKHFLERNKFPPICFEAWDFEWFEAQKQSLLETVTALGYRLMKISASDYLAQHPAYPVSLSVT